MELENDQKKNKEKYINIKNELSYIEEKINNLAEKSIESKKDFQKLKEKNKGLDEDLKKNIKNMDNLLESLE